MKSIFRNLFYTLCFIFGTTFLSGQEIIRATIMHDGLERDYILYVPQSYDGTQAYPLVFCFHGYTSSANTIMTYSRFNAKAAEENFLIVYPQGELLDGITHWNVGGWTLDSDVDDVGFTATLLEYLVDNYNINEDRVYSTGMSNGGYMSFQLACQLSDRFAAVASVTGSMTPQITAACNPQKTMPVLQIHGTSDLTVPYTGNVLWTNSIEEVMNYWIAHNNCDTNPEVSQFEDISQSDGSTADHFIYGSGTDGAVCEHIRINGGGHDWVGVWGNMDLNATDEVWRFFSQFDRTGLISNTSDLIETNRISFSPNPCQDYINIKLDGKSEINYELYNEKGEKLNHARLQNADNTIHTSTLVNGLYFIKIEGQLYRFVKI